MPRLIHRMLPHFICRAMPRTLPRTMRPAMAGALTALFLLGVWVRPAAAQVVVSPSAPESPSRAAIFQRAQRLVNDGLGAEGRALVDSLLNATTPRSADEAEVLFWRATLAETWDQAQRDYLRVMLDHERSPFASRAMLRLAQGELMRADTTAALRYLDRSQREWPEFADALVLRDRVLAARPVVAGMEWTVQIAAFPAASEAAAFAAVIRGRGYDARVDGTAAPFRVRFGYFATRAEAATAMDAYMRKERGNAFLAQVRRP
jgi:hypothetical protein